VLYQLSYIGCSNRSVGGTFTPKPGPAQHQSGNPDPSTAGQVGARVLSTWLGVVRPGDGVGPRNRTAERLAKLDWLARPRSSWLRRPRPTGRRRGRPVPSARRA